MVGKKGQMKIQQMAFMLIAVFVLFILIGIVLLSTKLEGIKRTATEYKEQNALTLSSSIANSPEFSCGNSYGSQKTDCVDLDKLMGLKNNVESYDKFWGVSNIEIRIIYPESERELECEIGNYPNCNYFKLREGEVRGFSVSNFVSVCHKERNLNVVANKCELGKIIISYEAEQ